MHSNAGTTETNRRIIQEMLDAVVTAGDLERALAVLDPEVVLYEAESLPYGGVHKGIDAVLTALAGAREELDFTSSEIDEVIVDGDRAVCLARIPLRASGEHIRLAELYVLRDGRIIEMRPFYWDTAVMLTTIG